jgi:hypothetical protein
VLTGLIFDDRGNRMSPSHSTKNGRRYHYYVSQALLQNRENVGSVARIPAPAIEQLVADRLRRIGEVDAAGLRSTGSPLRRVVIARSCIQIILDARFSAEEFRHRLPTTDSVAEADDVVTITIATQLITYGGRRIVEGPNGKPASDDGFYDLPLMKTLAKAHALRELLTTGNAASLRDLAKRSGCDESRIRHLLPLAFMAPDIVTMILGGKQPRHVTVDRVVRLGMPASWTMQRQVLGLTE